MAIYLSRKKGGTVATPITPSNSSPAQMTTDTPVNPTANGYAIASYDSVTPSGTPTSVSRGDIVKIDGGFDDVIVDRSIMNEVKGSNIYPQELYGGTLAKIWGNDPSIVTGYAIESYNTKTPSNSSPVALVSGEIDKIGGNGYAIEFYENDTPQSFPGYQYPANTILRLTNRGYTISDFTYVRPSNTNPPSLSQDTTFVVSQRNGYAIENYSSVTPSSTQVSVSEGDMVQVNGSGVIVDSITSITPSNASPATITSGTTYTATANGKAVSSVTDITPSNSSPVSLSSGTIYKPSASGYAISSYSSKTPSDSSPASVSSGAIIKASAAGYLYSSSGLGKCKNASLTISTSGQTTINCGFQPKYLSVLLTSGSNFYMCTYNSSVSTSYEYIASSGSNGSRVSLPSSNNNQINSITSTGFIMNKSGGTYTSGYYFAIG